MHERRVNGDKRPALELGVGAGIDGQTSLGKRPRGRPKGSKNRTKAGVAGGPGLVS